MKTVIKVVSTNEKGQFTSWVTNPDFIYGLNEKTVPTVGKLFVWEDCVEMREYLSRQYPEWEYMDRAGTRVFLAQTPKVYTEYSPASSFPYPWTVDEFDAKAWDDKAWEEGCLDLPIEERKTAYGNPSLELKHCLTCDELTLIKDITKEICE